jgi:hypothetical protein
MAGHAGERLRWIAKIFQEDYQRMLHPLPACPCLISHCGLLEWFWFSCLQLSSRHPGEGRDPAFRSHHGYLSEEQELDPGLRWDDDGEITNTG